VPNLLRKKIAATAVVSRQPTSTARQAQCVISHAANPVLSLPKAAAFDAEPGPQGMVYCVSKQLLRLRGLHMGLFCRFTKQQPEFRAECTELGRWCKGQIELKTAGQQEHPIDRGAAREIEEVSCVELAAEIHGEIVEHFVDRNAIRDAEREIQI
jgi:hypothetical protein